MRIHPRAPIVPVSLAPRKPLPSERATAKLTQFSCIAYGDTRGRCDGTALPVEHGMVVDAMLGTIKRSASLHTPRP